MEKSKQVHGMSPLTSKVIDALRFPLIVGVLVIHAVVPPGTLQRFSVDDVRFPVYDFISNFFSRILMECCVPLFFLIAGYLFFHNMPEFKWSMFGGKLRSRARTLLVPYLFWNLITFVALWIIMNSASMSHLIDSHDTYGTFPLNLWAVSDSMRGPISMQFWFIRDLMVCMALSPILVLIVNHTRHLGIILLFVAWVLGYKIPVVNDFGFSMVSIFFFSLGMWMSHNGKRDLVDMTRSVWFLGLLFPVMLLIFIIRPETFYIRVLSNLFIMFEMVFVVTLSAYAVERWNWAPSALLTSSAFFLFGYHVYFGQSPVRKALFAIIHPDSDWEMCLIYVGTIILPILIGVALFYLLDRYFPRFAAIITGGRTGKR